MLNDRRQAIVGLLANTSAVSRAADRCGRRQREGAGADAGAAEPGQRDVGEEPGQHRQGAAGVWRNIELTQGEIVVERRVLQRATSRTSRPAQLLQPFLDYAFGFRRGVNAGQPPDTAGPRAELPFPVNGIPQPGDLPNDGNP